MAREIYHASGVHYEELAERQLAACEAHGGGALPICMAKTQYSFSADPAAKGAPSGHVLPIKDVRVGALSVLLGWSVHVRCHALAAWQQCCTSA